jgi:quercetin dioxygenase-like cupin family protein
MNILENVPYNDDRMGSRKVVDEKHLLIMQIALKPKQAVPLHKANSNVYLLAFKGDITVNLDGTDNQINEGSILPVSYKTPMTITNNTDQNAMFLVLKTPNPSQMLA